MAELTHFCVRDFGEVKEKGMAGNSITSDVDYSRRAGLKNFSGCGAAFI